SRSSYLTLNAGINPEISPAGQRLIDNRLEVGALAENEPVSRIDTLQPGAGTAANSAGSRDAGEISGLRG
ncbi:MAG: hypothetical protein ABFS23_03510, partial [Pseudomonadota bacterium]